MGFLPLVTKNPALAATRLWAGYGELVGENSISPGKPCEIHIRHEFCGWTEMQIYQESYNVLAPDNYNSGSAHVIILIVILWRHKTRQYPDDRQRHDNETEGI